MKTLKKMFQYIHFNDSYKILMVDGVLNEKKKLSERKASFSPEIKPLVTIIIMKIVTMSPIYKKIM